MPSWITILLFAVLFVNSTAGLSCYNSKSGGPAACPNANLKCVTISGTRMCSARKDCTQADTCPGGDNCCCSSDNCNAPEGQANGGGGGGDPGRSAFVKTVPFASLLLALFFM